MFLDWLKSKWVGWDPLRTAKGDICIYTSSNICVWSGRSQCQYSAYLAWDEPKSSDCTFSKGTVRLPLQSAGYCDTHSFTSVRSPPPATPCRPALPYHALPRPSFLLSSLVYCSLLSYHPHPSLSLSTWTSSSSRGFLRDEECTLQTTMVQTLHAFFKIKLPRLRS